MDLRGKGHRPATKNNQFTNKKPIFNRLYETLENAGSIFGESRIFVKGEILNDNSG
jgi:hypothetical protein